MKIPRRVNVLSEVYLVKWQRGLRESHGADGMCDPDKYTIYLDPALRSNARVLKRVLWHEIGHAYCFESGLHENLHLQAIEMFCQNFSALVCQSGKILKF